MSQPTRTETLARAARQAAVEASCSHLDEKRAGKIMKAFAKQDAQRVTNIKNFRSKVKGGK